MKPTMRREKRLAQGKHECVNEAKHAEPKGGRNHDSRPCSRRARSVVCEILHVHAHPPVTQPLALDGCRVSSMTNSHAAGYEGK